MEIPKRSSLVSTKRRLYTPGPSLLFYVNAIRLSAVQEGVRGAGLGRGVAALSLKQQSLASLAFQFCKFSIYLLFNLPQIVLLLSSSLDLVMQVSLLVA